MFWHWHWVSKGEAEKEAFIAAFEDIDNSNDRAAAILAATFLEDHLAIALKKRFHQDEKILNETFRSSGPLGSFSAKINMAFLIGLCSKETCKELHTIKEIRNEFAHKGLTRDFNSKRVRDLANNLTFGKKWEITIRRIPEEGEAPEESAFVSGEEDMPKTPREHYMKACQMLLTCLVYHTNRSSPPPPEPPEELA